MKNAKILEPDVPVSANKEKQTVVVIGNGMVGHKFIEQLQDAKAAGKGDDEIITFCEEPLLA